MRKLSGKLPGKPPAVRCLVLGGGGQVGTALKRVLPEESGSYVKTKELYDITQTRQLVEKISMLQPDVVINCAAYTRVQEAEKNREWTWRVNAKAVGQLAWQLASRSIPLIHLSTDFVFGQDRQRLSPYLEHDCTGPCGHYGHTKAAGELAIWHTAYAFPNWHFFIIRTAGVFELPWREYRNFPTAITQQLLLKKPLPVVADVRTNITAAEDLAAALCYFARQRQALPSGCYHVTNSTPTSWYRVAEQLALRLPKVKAEIVPVTWLDYAEANGQDPDKTGRYTCLDSSKYALLPQSPKMRPWQDAIDCWVRARTAKI